MNENNIWSLAPTTFLKATSNYAPTSNALQWVKSNTKGMNTNGSIFGNIGNSFGNMGRNILQQMQDHPFDTMNSMASGAMSIWNAYQNYKNNKDQYQLNQDYYNLAKSQYEANEARNKEAFNWQRQNRLSSSL